MKTITTTLFFFAASVLANAQEPDAAIGQLIQQRGDLLSRIHEMTEERYRAGSAQKEDVMAAALALFTFRRNYSNEVSGKIQWQERIVALLRERSVLFGERKQAGLVIATEALRAAEQALEAEQQLLELKAGS
ncbi:MAG: hypothetical protein V4675_18375 [Verrucomicrobiota bacterium]